MARWLLLLLTIAVSPAVADDGAGSTPSASAPALRYQDLEPGFKALDTLAALKADSDARLAACMNAFGERRFCTCVNQRLSLQLSFDDYIALVTKNADDPAWIALPDKKRAMLKEATDVRDRCARDAAAARP
jgi:hypothetical protein